MHTMETGPTALLRNSMSQRDFETFPAIAAPCMLQQREHLHDKSLSGFPTRSEAKRVNSRDPVMYRTIEISEFGVGAIEVYRGNDRQT